MALQDSASAARATVADSAPSLTLTDAMIEVTPSSCSSSTTAPGQVSVTISYPFELVSGFLPIDDFTLTGRGTMRCFG